jgi:hypothetical protein
MAIKTVQDMSARGKLVRDIRNIFVPGKVRCMCVFEALNPAHCEGAERHGYRPFLMRPYTRLMKDSAGGEIQ